MKKLKIDLDSNNDSGSGARLSLPIAGPPLLALGADLKPGFCLSNGKRATLYALNGELSGPSARANYEALMKRQMARCESAPEFAVHDPHPDFVSTRYALRTGLPTVSVQHHHAHMAAVMAESGLAGPALGVILDGMGLGEDGSLWGGEFLVGGLSRVRRAGHLKSVPQPGGDSAAREPWRMAVSHLAGALGEKWTDGAGGILERQGRERCELVERIARLGVNSPPTSSAGRLFDAVSSLLGICDVNRTPAEAAIALENSVGNRFGTPFEFTVVERQGVYVADPAPGIRDYVERMQHNEPVDLLAADFHDGLARMIESVANRIRKKNGIETVVLSGGVFQNRLLSEMCNKRLADSGFRVVSPRLVPVHDGGLAYGQAAAAGALLAEIGA